MLGGDPEVAVGGVVLPRAYEGTPRRVGVPELPWTARSELRMVKPWKVSSSDGF